MLLKLKSMLRMIVIYWNYYFGSLDRMFRQICVAEVY
jgi:hypothetical protein